jgi:hypothetical protein
MFKYTLYLGTTSKEKDFSEDIELAFMNNELGFEALDGYTLYSGIGYYQGTKEKCHVLTHFGHLTSEDIIKKICIAYKDKFKQESILMTRELINPLFEIQNI